MLCCGFASVYGKDDRAKRYLKRSNNRPTRHFRNTGSRTTCVWSAALDSACWFVSSAAAPTIMSGDTDHADHPRPASPTRLAHLVAPRQWHDRAPCHPASRSRPGSRRPLQRRRRRRGRIPGRVLAGAGVRRGSAGCVSDVIVPSFLLANSQAF
jgi:hypothetical protein